jgi:D-threo-aldose 1-dehydrogenase
MSITDQRIGGPLGFSSAPLGNTIRNFPEAVAAATVEAARQPGVRYFDTAPRCVASPFEIRLDRALAEHNRGE